MAKEKQIRTYDQDGFRRRAACLCVRDPDESEIMLVTSTRAPEYWIVPGGGIEPNEDPNDAAIRETEEEAGVKGVIKRCLGDFEVCDENTARKHRTVVFVLEVQEELDEWEDSRSRRRCWFSIEKAISLLAIYKPVQMSYVRLMIETSPSVQFRHLLSTLPQSSDAVINQTDLLSVIRNNKKSENDDHQHHHDGGGGTGADCTTGEYVTSTSSSSCHHNDQNNDQKNNVVNIGAGNNDSSHKCDTTTAEIPNDCATKNLISGNQENTNS